MAKINLVIHSGGTVRFSSGATLVEELKSHDEGSLLAHLSINMKDGREGALNLMESLHEMECLGRQDSVSTLEELITAVFQAGTLYAGLPTPTCSITADIRLSA